MNLKETFRHYWTMDLEREAAKAGWTLSVAGFEPISVSIIANPTDKHWLLLCGELPPTISLDFARRRVQHSQLTSAKVARQLLQAYSPVEYARIMHIEPTYETLPGRLRDDHV